MITYVSRDFLTTLFIDCNVKVNAYAPCSAYTLMLLVMILFCLNSSLVIWLDGQLFILTVLLVLLVWMLIRGKDCMCSSFGPASVTLCNGLAAVARCLCVDDIIIFC